MKTAESGDVAIVQYSLDAERKKLWAVLIEFDTEAQLVVVLMLELYLLNLIGSFCFFFILF